MTKKRHLCWQCKKLVDTVIEITTGDTKSKPTCRDCLALALSVVRGSDPVARDLATTGHAPRGES